MPNRNRIIRHEAVPKSGSYEVRFADGWNPGSSTGMICRAGAGAGGGVICRPSEQALGGGLSFAALWRRECVHRLAAHCRVPIQLVGAVYRDAGRATLD